MLHENFPRILVGACTKCRGALREQMEPEEWMCINCGLLVLENPVDISQIDKKTKWSKQKQPQLPIFPSEEEVREEVIEVVEEVPSLETLEQEIEEEEGDDQEWENLITYHTNKMTDQSITDGPKTPPHIPTT